MHDETGHHDRPWAGGGIFRPDKALRSYYITLSVLLLPGFLIAFPIYMARYYTLRYRLDEHGVWMRVGLLFRKESNLTYRRIQDVHVTRGLIQRWFGIASVSVQTASGSSAAEVTIEGVRDPDSLRDFLYARMRGAKEELQSEAADAHSTQDEALVLLREIRDVLASRGGEDGGVS